MSAVATPATYTMEEFLALPDHKHYELVDGELVEINVSNLSVVVATKLGARLVYHCEANKLGEVFAADSYYQCFPDQPRHGRKPDVSFIRKERLPHGWLEDGYFTIHPDLAVEVISPGDSAYQVNAKIKEYLDADIPLVWVIYPEDRESYVHRLDGTVSKLEANEFLEGESVIPGFRCLLADIFPEETIKPKA